MADRRSLSHSFDDIGEETSGDAANVGSIQLASPRLVIVQLIDPRPVYRDTEGQRKHKAGFAYRFQNRSVEFKHLHQQDEKYPLLYSHRLGLFLC